ncbi:hypothetical protein LYNGBM3L_75670 [Moorena producens 3L]|uniref:Uncharacterized protein n=1 Tax=Moorena producens 3L TaxID=489825 RepID=F4XRE8_9CYAN|nr:hypothetical protein LYNGBM3L_75670 [Moorena producens 3L]
MKLSLLAIAHFTRIELVVFAVGLDPPKSPLIRGTFKIHFRTPPNDHGGLGGIKRVNGIERDGI